MYLKSNFLLVNKLILTTIKFDYFGQFPGIKVVGLGADHYHSDARVTSNLELNLVLLEAQNSSSFPKSANIGVCHSWGGLDLELNRNVLLFATGPYL